MEAVEMEKDLLAATAPAEAAKETWRPTDEKGADWCLGKIRETETEMETITRFVESKKKELDKWLEKRLLPLQGDKEHFSALLQNFAEESLQGSKKRSISLPNGKFGFRKRPAKFQKDEDVLLAYVKAEVPSCVKVKESVDWATLKKNCTVDGDHLVSQDGEVVPGVTVEVQPDTFYTEVK